MRFNIFSLIASIQNCVISVVPIRHTIKHYASKWQNQFNQETLQSDKINSIKKKKTVRDFIIQSPISSLFKTGVDTHKFIKVNVPVKSGYPVEDISGPWRQLKLFVEIFLQSNHWKCAIKPLKLNAETKINVMLRRK